MAAKSSALHNQFEMANEIPKEIPCVEAVVICLILFTALFSFESV